MKIKPLKKGDKVAIVAPSGFLEKEDLLMGLNFLEENFLEPQLGKNLFNKSGTGYNFAGTENERIIDFQEAINDSSVKAIFCARGGYGAIKIIDKLDFSPLNKDFKWVIGYSDITVIHNKLSGLHIPSLHGINAKGFSKNATKESYETLRKVLYKETLEYNLNLKTIRYKDAEGILVGGNISILYSQLGCLDKSFFKNKILFIEDWYENYYHLDRMLMNMKRNGIFNDIKALIVGSFTRMEDVTNINYNQDFDEIANTIIKNELSEYDFPILFNFPAGHINDNRTLVMGSTVKIIENKSKIKISFDF